MHRSHVEDYCRAPKGGLRTSCHGYIIRNKSDKGQDAALRVEMGNVGSYQFKYLFSGGYSSNLRGG